MEVQNRIPEEKEPEHRSEHAIPDQITGDTGAEQTQGIEREAPQNMDNSNSAVISENENAADTGTENISTEVPGSDEVTETQPETREFVLDENGKIPLDAVRPYLQENLLVLEPDGKIPSRELLSHMPAGMLMLPAVFAILAAAEAMLLAMIWRRRRKAEFRSGRSSSSLSWQNEKDEATVVEDYQKTSSALASASLHHIGRRESQQDSLGITRVETGLFAVVADGMGGLVDGDKVSRKIIQCMLQDAENNRLSSLNGNLNQMIAHANDEVNRMLGPREEYISGSTVVAALAEPGRFQWISVGDSRIYLYRGGMLLQLNREHVYESELLHLAVNRDLDFQDAHGHSRKKSVSSFIGMGKLKYIDEPMRPIPAQCGDRLLLSSDGVFNTLSDEEIAEILRQNPEPNTAAKVLETAVLNRRNPYQDNFTAILIAWQ